MKSALFRILFLVLLICTDGLANTISHIDGNTPNVSFTTSEIRTSPAAIVEVCIKYDGVINTSPIHVELVQQKRTDQYFPSRSISVNLFPGTKESCVRIKAPRTEGDYPLEISGTAKSLVIKVETVDDGKEAWCGAFPRITPDSVEYPVAVDNFGNRFSVDMIRIPTPTPTNSIVNNNAISPNCGCDEIGISLSLFEPYFEDCIYNSTKGFDDPDFGTGRREVLCASLAYLERLIVPNQSICHPEEVRKVNIRVLPSDAVANYPTELPTIHPRVLGYASPLYSSRSYYAGIRHPWPWEIINSGEYPSIADEDFYHAETRFNFLYPDRIAWQLEYNEPVTDDRYDLYTVALHEFTHAVGFASAFNSVTGELGSRQGLGRYNNFDQHLQITYDDHTTHLDLIENGTPENGFSFSYEWFFNDEVDGLGINDPDDPSDLHSSCPGSGPHITFAGQGGNHPLYTGEEFRGGSSFSHFDGNCTNSTDIDFIDFVMHPFLSRNEYRRLFQWQELDALRTMGYNIDCSSGDFLDENPDDANTFNCDASDDNCAIGSVSYITEELEGCDLPIAFLTIPTCPGAYITIIDVDAVLSNDPNANTIAFIHPLFDESAGVFVRDEDSYSLTTYSWGSFRFSYAPVRCDGAIGNISTFVITTFPGEDCEDLVSCTNKVTCESLEIPAGWDYCEEFSECEEVECNLVCNGGFCGTAVKDQEPIAPAPNTTAFVGTLNDEPFHVLNDFSLVSPTGWIKGGKSPDYHVTDNDFVPTLNLPLIGLRFLEDAPMSSNHIESIYTYLNPTPVEGENYLFSADHYISQYTPSYRMNVSAQLIQGQFYEPCENDNFCYDPDAPSQTIFDPSGLVFPDSRKYKSANCFTADENFNALLLTTNDIDVARTYELIDNIELLPDNFTAGIDRESDFCGLTVNLGGEPFCMLSGLEVEYNWYELDANGDIIEPAIFTYTQDVINSGNSTSFPVAPMRTTSYRLVRSITDLGDFPADFEFCNYQDDVTVTVIEALPIPDFIAESVDNECGVYNFFSAPTTIGDSHSWYFGEANASNLFSTNANPTNVELPNGSIVVVHRAENDCGIEEFQIELEVACDTCFLEGPNDINIEAEEGVLLSSLIADEIMPSNGVQGRRISIKGNLIVDPVASTTDGFYEINDSEVRMYPGAVITVQAGAGLSIEGNINGGIHGCEALWQGIHLDPAPADNSSIGGQIKLDNALIQDAVHAIQLDNFSAFQMENTTLNRNHIGIYVLPSIDFQNLNQPGLARTTAIISTDDLLPPYPGQEIATTSKSYAGMELNNCKIHFRDMKIADSYYGAIVRNASLDLRASIIHDLTPDPNNTFGVANAGIITTKSDDVDWGTGATVGSSRFYNMQFGVFGRNGNLIFQDNNIVGEDEQGDHYNVQVGIRLIEDIGNFAWIRDDNVFYTQWGGIEIHNAQKAHQITIQDNKINLFPLTDSPYSSGIFLLDAQMINIGNSVSIKNNSIALHSFGSGIQLWNVNGAAILNNKVAFTENYNATSEGMGIRLHQASKCTLGDNNIVNEAFPNAQTGIFVRDGDVNTFCCNLVHGTYYGVVFDGYCDNTKLRQTSFEKNSIGLQCNNNSRIGVQEAAGNTWDQSFIRQARHLSTNSEDVINSEFKVDVTLGDSYAPTNVEVVSNVDWFIDFPHGNILLCEDGPLNCLGLGFDDLVSDEDFINKLLSGDYENGAYPVTSKWEAERLFYRGLSATQASLSSNWAAEVEPFFEMHSTGQTDLHKLTLIDQALEETMAFDTAFQTIVNRQIELSHNLSQLEASLEPGEEATAGFLEAWSENIRLQTEVYQEYSVAVSQKKSAYLDVVAQLQQQSSDIVTGEAASTLQQLQALYLSSMAINEENLPDSTEVALRLIAERCPQRYGAAVGRAQSILRFYNKAFETNYECSAENSGLGYLMDSTEKMASSAEPIRNRSSSSTISVYPNPNDGIVNILLPEVSKSRDWEVHLLDINGRIVESSSSIGGLLRIDATHLAAGVYWVRVQSDATVITKRFVLR